MEKRNLKKIIKELKILLDELESEVYSDPSVYVLLGTNITTEMIEIVIKK